MDTHQAADQNASSIWGIIGVGVVLVAILVIVGGIFGGKESIVSGEVTYSSYAGPMNSDKDFRNTRTFSVVDGAGETHFFVITDVSVTRNAGVIKPGQKVEVTHNNRLYATRPEEVKNSDGTIAVKEASWIRPDKVKILTPIKGVVSN